MIYRCNSSEHDVEPGGRNGLRPAMARVGGMLNGAAQPQTNLGRAEARFVKDEVVER